jgi:hypothetical protein
MEYRQMVFENSVLWKIFGPKREEVTTNLKKLHNAELHLYSSPYTVCAMKWRRISGRGWGMWPEWETGKSHTDLGCGTFCNA